jgi:TetR/AcrR family transcriptional regulator
MGRLKRAHEAPDARIRQLLLKSATQLFNSKGYAATTVREIVASAGVSKPVLYYYFGSKEGIYMELMSDFRKFEEVVKVRRKEEGKAREKIMGLLSRTYALFLEHIDMVRIMYSLYYGPPQGAPFIDFDHFYRKFWVTVRELIEEGCERGEFRKVDVNLATWAVVGPLSVATEAGICRDPEGADIVSAEGLSQVLGVILDGISIADSKGEKC